MSKSEVLSGSALLAQMDEADDIVKVTYKNDDLRYDLGNLAAFDTHPINEAEYRVDREKYLLTAATANFQLMLKHIFEFPIEKTELGPVALLPEKITRFPRAKPVPQPKPLTTWEKFALAKGIKKKGRQSRMVYDEATGEYAPRFGYKRARDDSAPWAYELKPGDDPSIDHIERLALKKKERVVNNQLNQLKNIRAAEKAKDAKTGFSSNLLTNSGAPSKKKRDASSVPIGIPSTVSIVEGRASGVTGNGKQPKPRPGGESLDVKKSKLALAQVSTASMGRFDDQLKGEPKRPKDPRKQKRLPNFTGLDKEKVREANVLKKVLGASLGEGEVSGSANATKMGPTKAKKAKAPQKGGKKGGKKVGKGRK